MKQTLTVVAVMLATSFAALAQDGTEKTWTLQECLDYAIENNIQIQQTRNTYLSGVEDTESARADMLPSVSASSSQGFTNYPSSDVDENNSYSGTYDVNASMTLFQGGTLRNTLKSLKIQNDIDALSVEEAENDIRVSIVQAYMQVLYAKEAVEIAESNAEISKAQRDRAELMKEAGSISKVDLAQFDSQYASDRYEVVSAKVSLDTYLLQLKQLLELDITEDINIAAPEIEDEDVLRIIPNKVDIYENALNAMPEIKRGQLAIDQSELSIKTAKAGYSPSLSLSAGLGTGHLSGLGTGFGTQMKNNFNESVGLTLSIPIYSNRNNKTAVAKAKIAADNSRLESMDLQKTLLQKVENSYLDAISSQSQYVAAEEKEKYAKESFDLTTEQFHEGIKNTVELLSAQNEYSSARQEVLQTKFIAVMNMALLDIYQGNEVEL